MIDGVAEPTDERAQPETRRAVLIDDHPLLGLGLKARLVERGVHAELADLGPRDELLAWVLAMSPDLVVIDLGLPYDGGGLELVAPLVDKGLNVLNLTGETSIDLWARCFESGSLGVLGKTQPLDEIIDAIVSASEGRMVDSGHRQQVLHEARQLRAVRDASLEPFRALSGREAVVLSGLTTGQSPQQLATRDFVSIETVRSQIKSVLRKLQVSSQLEAVAMAHHVGWTAKADDE